MNIYDQFLPPENLEESLLVDETMSEVHDEGWSSLDQQLSSVQSKRIFPVFFYRNHPVSPLPI